MEVFFSRPGKKGEIKERIITDIKYARKRLLISIYSLSDPDIAGAINESKALDKRIVYNHKVDLEKTTIGEKVVSLIQDKNFLDENCAALGSNTFSQMHHKFIITDDALWTGTYNLSFNAGSNNWENMLRIVEKDVITKFIKEFDKMFVFSKAIENKLKQNKCDECKCVVDDPFEHFRILYLTKHDNKVNIKKGFNSFYDEGTIFVTSDDDGYDSFDISNNISTAYKAKCLTNVKGSKWAECHKCKEKGIEEHMPAVIRRIRNLVKKDDPNWTKLRDFLSFEEYPDKITCLDCLHSTIIEESKINSPDSISKIPFTNFSFTEDPF